MTWPCMFSDLKCVGPITMRKSLLTIILTSLAVFPEIHRRRSSVNFRGHQIFARKICIKNQQNARILLILARKIIKIPKFLYLPEKFTKFPNVTWFCPKIARILHNNLHNNCPKNIFSRISWGHVPPPCPRLLRLWVFHKSQHQSKPELPRWPLVSTAIITCTILLSFLQ